MFQLQNKTPFLTCLLPARDPDGGDTLVVIVKGTFSIADAGTVQLAAEQAPFVMADQYHGEPAASSLRYASDLVPEKRGTDVVLNGSAYATSGEADQVDVSLEAGPLRKTVRVFGDRHWKRSLGLVASTTKPAPFARMPLTYEHAFGGVDKTHPSEKQWKFEPRNPVGKGLIANANRLDFNEVRLPNLEDPAALVSWYQDAPAPAGFGFIAPTWEPRKNHAGTYDQAWQEGRCPLLPADFDARFYNAGHPDLISKDFFRGGEAVRVSNASRSSSLAFDLPAIDVRAEFFIDGSVTRQTCNLDTVVIEPDAQRVLLTWRSKVGCHRKIKLVTGVRVTAGERNLH